MWSALNTRGCGPEEIAHQAIESPLHDSDVVVVPVHPWVGGAMSGAYADHVCSTPQTFHTAALPTFFARGECPPATCRHMLSLEEIPGLQDEFVLHCAVFNEKAERFVVPRSTLAWQRLTILPMKQAPLVRADRCEYEIGNNTLLD